MYCPICSCQNAHEFDQVSGYVYFECESCKSIFIEPSVLDEIDGGRSIVNYDEAYWKSELAASRERSFGPSLARAAEVFLYAKRDIEVFLDIGSGAGYFLDSISQYLPSSKSKFFGVEKYPPVMHNSSSAFFVGDVCSFPKSVDAGICIEVIEHLTPSMLNDVLRSLAKISNNDSLFLFNSGQPHYVKNEDRKYLDPVGRGHIVSYSIEGIRFLAEPFGFHVHSLPGKAWAFVLEKTQNNEHGNIEDRIWSARQSNKASLNDPLMGSIMYILGIESARAYR